MTFSVRDATYWRDTASERMRTADIEGLLPLQGETALDVGARDGYFSLLLAERYSSVTALDLSMPRIPHPRIRCVQGDVTDLDFPDDTFDVVVCTEVLEHIAGDRLQAATSELARVSRHYLLVGVPYRQDIRVGRTTCRTCGATNPPWGHVNSFDEAQLLHLFPGLRVLKRSFVGENRESTNAMSTFLMDLADNPYGTYGQEEGCIRCGAPLKEPPTRNFPKKVLTKAAFFTRFATEPLRKRRPNWIHLLFGKH